MTADPNDRTMLKAGPGVLFREGVDSFTQGNAKAALQHFRQTLRTAKRNGDQNNVAWSLLHMAMVLRGQRRYTDLIQLLEQARQIFLDLDNKFGLASVFQELSLANRELDRNALALEYAHQAVKMFKDLGRMLELAWAYDNLAVIHFNLYHRHEILTYAKKARAIFLEFDSEIGLAWNACNLGGLYLEMGYYARAERYYGEAIRMFTKLKSKQGVAWSALGLGTVMRAQYKFKEALDAVRKAKRLFRDLGLKDREGWCLLNEGAILRVAGEEADAEQMNKKALQLFSPLRNHDGVAWCLFQIGQLHRDRGQFVKAWQTLREALNLHTDISNRKGIGWSENEWGKAYMELNDQSHARECFIKAKVIAEQLDEGPLKAEVDKNLARLNIEEGLLQRAAGFLHQTEALCQKQSSRDVEAEVYLEQARFALTVIDIDNAADAVKKAGALINKYNLRRLQPALKIFEAEMKVGQRRLGDARRILEDALELSGALKQRRSQADAVMGLIQLDLARDNGANLSGYFSDLERGVRVLSSRKIKAKSLLLKNYASFLKRESMDGRLLNQCLQILRTSGFAIIERQTLDLLSDIYADSGKTKELNETKEQAQRLLEHGSVDLHLVRSRKETFPELPISLTA